MGFVSFRKFFLDNTRVRIFFLSREAGIFFPEFNIRLYVKNSESDYFLFLPPKSEYFFSNIGNQNIFFRKKTKQKTITPPLQVKWSVPYTLYIIELVLVLMIV
jgi:hypothetical protein